MSLRELFFGVDLELEKEKEEFQKEQLREWEEERKRNEQKKFEMSMKESIKEELWEDIRNELRRHNKFEREVRDTLVRQEVARQLSEEKVENNDKLTCPCYCRGVSCSPARMAYGCKNCECYVERERERNRNRYGIKVVTIKEKKEENKEEKKEETVAFNVALRIRNDGEHRYKLKSIGFVIVDKCLVDDFKCAHRMFECKNYETDATKCHDDYKRFIESHVVSAHVLKPQAMYVDMEMVMIS